MNEKVFVIIPSFNGGEQIIRCLDSLKEVQTPGLDQRIIVVDNASSDNSQEKITENFPEVEIIKNQENLGFAKAVNMGIRKALDNNSQYVLLLNQDTIVPPNLIKTLIDNDGDIVAPIIKFQRNGKTILDHGGVINWWTGRASHREFSQKIVNLHPVDYLSFCCALIKKDVFDKIGLLDERYFLYFEDADFCQRAKIAGFRLVVAENAELIHNIEEHKYTSRLKTKLFKTYHLIKSNLVFINQYLPLYKKPIGWFYIFVLTLKSLINLVR